MEKKAILLFLLFVLLFSCTAYSLELEDEDPVTFSIDKAKLQSYLVNNGITPEIAGFMAYSFLVLFLIVSGTVVSALYFFSGMYRKNAVQLGPVPWGVSLSMSLLFLLIFLTLSFQVLFGSLLKSGFIREIPSMTAQMLMSELIIIFVIGVFSVVVYKRYYWKLAALFETKKIREGIIYGVLAYVGFYPLYMLLSKITAVIAEYFGFQLKIQAVVSSIKDIKSLWELLSYILFIVFIAPIIEEIFFRGILYRGCKRFLGVAGASLLSAFLFSAVHMNLLSFLPIFGLGIAFCHIYEKTGSIYSSIIFHAIHNALGLAGALLVYRMMNVMGG
ncbi:MAG: CPBP family intramembrane metalloprotease [Candidatus Aureabacteria bacterium]|nr:CPBP family intramembrane metalloprotease [Candidatus Auribacterota bacterium]